MILCSSSLPSAGSEVGGSVGKVVDSELVEEVGKVQEVLGEVS